MKKYSVNMTMTVAVTVEVEAEDEEQAGKLALEKAGREEAYYLSHYDSVWDREVTEASECEQEPESEEEKPTEKVPYSKAYEKIQYFYVEKTMEKTAGEVEGLFREYTKLNTRLF